MTRIINTFSCSKSWDELGEGAEKRHCSSCNKYVHDLTGKSDLETSRLTASGSVCGVIQKNRVSLGFTSLMAGLTLASMTMFQSVTVQAQEVQPSLKKSKLKRQEFNGIKGKIVEKSTGEFIPFAVVVIYYNDSLIGEATTNFDGEFEIRSLKIELEPTDLVTIQAQFVGYGSYKRTCLLRELTKGSLKIKLEDRGVLTGVMIIEAPPAIHRDGSNEQTIYRQDIQRMPR